MANHKNTEKKFWGFVDQRSDEECWLWTGSLWKTGYGRFIIFGKDDRAHRIAMKLSGVNVGSHCVLHHCDNRKCCNPKHLFLGTRSENNADKVSKGRQARGDKLKQTKLALVDIVAIRASTLSDKKLASAYGVTYGHIYKIRKMKKWAYV